MGNNSFLTVDRIEFIITYRCNSHCKHCQIEQYDRCISAEPGGRISVCDEFYIGNAHESDIIEMLEEYDPYQIPEMKALLEGDVAELARLAFAKGVQADPGGYYSVCDMCKSIRRAMSFASYQ